MTASEKYREAVALYRDTAMTQTEICRALGLDRKALSRYIGRCHRDLLLRRNGVDSAVDADAVKLRTSSGQTPAARAKYAKAIEACRSEKWIELNVSQIARMYGLDGTALANQLRAHYPDVIPQREAERARRGIADNFSRGPRRESVDTYLHAVELLKLGKHTIEEAAKLCNVSFTGLRQYVLFYCKDLVAERRTLREEGKTNPVRGEMGGNGRRRVPTESTRKRYSEAVRLFSETALSEKEIAVRTGVGLSAFRNYLRTWHSNLILERRGVAGVADSRSRLPLTAGKRYEKAAAEKYSEAIAALRNGVGNTSEVARQFGLHPDVFRIYLREHEPDLWQSLGMVRLDNGHTVLRRSAEKYAEAIRLYTTTAEPLRSITERLGLVYKSTVSYIRRNCPEAAEKHAQIVDAQISTQ